MNNYGCDEPIEIRLYCENAKVVFGYDDAYIYYNDGRVEEAHQDENTADYEGGKDYWGFQHIRQIADFYKSVEEGTEPFISGREALKIQKVVCAIYESAKSGKTVRFE
jgi:predicted dehydrogenase